jgi:hypothetical protein
MYLLAIISYKLLHHAHVRTITTKTPSTAGSNRFPDELTPTLFFFQSVTTVKRAWSWVISIVTLSLPDHIVVGYGIPFEIFPFAYLNLLLLLLFLH